MNNSNKFPSHRQLRVGEQLRQLISILLIKEELNIQVLKKNYISIVEVDMSPDLKNAKIYVAINTQDNDYKIIDDLNSKNGLIKKKLSKSLQLKFFPNLKFYLDSSVEYSKNINNILKNLA